MLVPISAQIETLKIHIMQNVNAITKTSKIILPVLDVNVEIAPIDIIQALGLTH
jgi:hypothetical protein